MILRKPTYTIIEQGEGLDGILKQIELAGRTCYKSTDKISEGSAKDFVDRMVASKHGAMLEHGTVYLTMEWNTTDLSEKVSPIKYKRNPFSKVNYVSSQNEPRKVTAYVTTNYRVLVENGWLDDLKYLSAPTEFHEKRYTVEFEMDRAGANSVVRHRSMSFGQESTRFCNYSKDKFNHEVKISMPHWVATIDVLPALKESDYKRVFDEFLTTKANGGQENKSVHLFDAIRYWLMANELSEFFYFKLLECGLKAEDARAVLPLDLDTQIVVTGFASDWEHFFSLRADSATGRAHPDIKMIAQPLKDEFSKRGYLK